MRVRLESLGCRLNISEMETLARQLVGQGHRLVGPGEPTDLCVLNSCTVTSLASSKTRRLMRQIQRANPGVRLAVTGCYAEMSPDAVRRTGADLLISNRDKDRIVERLSEAGLLIDADPLPTTEPLLPGASGRTRAFVKVQDGCDNRCTFCIVTLARGEGRSRPRKEIVSEIRDLVAHGYQEAVLSGIHLGSYGHDLGEPHGLAELVSTLLRETDLPRLRLSSLEPWDLAPSFFELFEDPRLLPHLHLPLQSGCDETLRRMARGTTRQQYADLLARARDTIPEVAISSDIIVGFPGETEEEFEESRAFVEAMEFSRLHIFRYSPRPGTRAATLPGQVPPPTAAERSRTMHRLADGLERSFQQRYLNRTVSVLWEEAEETDWGRRWYGLTPNYLRVVVEAPADLDLSNCILPARVEGRRPGALWGRLEEAA